MFDRVRRALSQLTGSQLATHEQADDGLPLPSGDALFRALMIADLGPRAGQQFLAHLEEASRQRGALSRRRRQVAALEEQAVLRRREIAARAELDALR